MSGQSKEYGPHVTVKACTWISCFYLFWTLYKKDDKYLVLFYTPVFSGPILIDAYFLNPPPSGVANHVI